MSRHKGAEDFPAEVSVPIAEVMSSDDDAPMVQPSTLRDLQAKFEHDVRAGSYARSTLKEFGRTWKHFVAFLHEQCASIPGVLDPQGAPALPLQKSSCVLFIRHVSLTQKPVPFGAADVSHCSVGAGAINNAVAALKFYGFPGGSVPADIQHVFRQAARTQARFVAHEQLHNRHPVKQSQSLSWPALKLVLAFARIHDPDLHCFLLDVLQSVSRGQRVACGGWASMDWVEDHLTKCLNTSKCDQSAQHSYPKQFFFSNDVDFCLITALGRKVLTTKPEHANPFIFQHSVQTYERRLKDLLVQMPDRHQLGMPIGLITLHSVKRTVYKFLRTVPVPQSAIKTRAEHQKSGLEHAYAGKDEGPSPIDDATMGRSVAGLPIFTESFYIIPPHFSHLAPVLYERFVPMHGAMQNLDQSKTMLQFNKVLPQLMAAVIHHYHNNDHGLTSQDSLFRCPLWGSQTRLRFNLHDQLQGGGRSSSRIQITGRNLQHDAHLILLATHRKQDAILTALSNFGQQQNITPSVLPVRNAPHDRDTQDDSEDSDSSEAAPVQTASSGHLHAQMFLPALNHTGRELMILPMSLFDLFVRYVIGVCGRPALRILSVNDIPKHLSSDMKAQQRTLFSKTKFVFAAMLGKTNPSSIDGNNVALIYDRLMRRVAVHYGDLITAGSVRTVYNKMRKNMPAYQELCQAPPVSLNHPRQMLLHEFPQTGTGIMAPVDSDDDFILDIDDAEPCQDIPEEVKQCLVCPYCDEDPVGFTFLTRKMLLDHVRKCHMGCVPPSANIVKVVNSVKVGQSSTSRWVRVQHAIASIPKAATSTPSSPSSGKPANLSSTILAKGEVRCGHFVQVFNHSKHRWFAMVADGRIMGRDTGSPHLLAAYWCKPNSLELDSTRAKEMHLDLASIIAVGAKEEFNQAEHTASTPGHIHPRRILDFFSPAPLMDSGSQHGDSGLFESRDSDLHSQSAVCSTEHTSDGGVVDGGGCDGIGDGVGGAVGGGGAGGGAVGGDGDGDGDGDGGVVGVGASGCIDLETLHDNFIREARQMVRVPNPGNGDCLFHALKHGTGFQGSHGDLRKNIVDHSTNNLHQMVAVQGNRAVALHTLLSDNGSLVTRAKPNVYNNRAQYFRCMAKPGTWGEELELASAALLLQVCIHLFSPKRKEGLQFQYFAPAVDSASMRHVYLLNDDGQSHYECLESHAICTPPTSRKRSRAAEACSVPVHVDIECAASVLRCLQHGGIGDRDECLLCTTGRKDLYIRDGVIGYSDDACTRGQCDGIGAPDCGTCQHILDCAEKGLDPNMQPLDDYYSIQGEPSSRIATQAQSQKWWCEAVAAIPSLQQDKATFAWTQYVKHLDKDRQNGSLHPKSFQVLVEETIKQLGARKGINFLDLGSEAGMALWHFMLHPAIRQVTGIEIDVFWFKVATQLLTHVAQCAREAHVHVASVILIRQDFLDNSAWVASAMAEADIVYTNNVQFDKKKKNVPKQQRAVPCSTPFSGLINPNLAAKFFRTTERDRVVLAVFEYHAFENKLTKRVQSLQLQPTWGTSTTEVALLLYDGHKQSETPKRLRPHKQQIYVPMRTKKGVHKQQPDAPPSRNMKPRYGVHKQHPHAPPRLPSRRQRV
jgi:hypothetical protein